MKPPYEAPYWDRLTTCQQINDLVHKIAQTTGCSYPAAYAEAAKVINAPGLGRYANRLARAGQAHEAIERLCQWHKTAATEAANA